MRMGSLNLPPILARLIPRLASPFDAEVTATARAIERALKSQKLDWHDLAAVVTAQSSKPFPVPSGIAESPRAMEIRAWLEAISRERWMNAWTHDFVGDMLVRGSLDRISAKQADCIDKIIAEAYRRGVRP